MRLPLLILTIFSLFCFSSKAQTKTDSLQSLKSDSTVIKDSLAYKDSVRLEKLLEKADYPVIKRSKYSAALAVSNIDEKPDPKMKYKLLVEITGWEKDSASVRKVSGSLAEAGRILNLHIEAEIDKKNIEMVIVAHAGALNALLTNEKYKKKFHTDNPNLDIIKQFQDNNIKIIACGQAMHFVDISKEDLLPVVKVALSAKIVLSTYLSKGFILFNG
ncbi:MAG: DsrE family protein [Bacteroidetes bacterium]|nr:DsrE family protein [Bacteroidota bacterium]